MAHGKTTEKQAASNAAKVLRDPKAAKSAAGSALSQVHKRRGK